MRHFKDPKFKPLYDALPPRARNLADKNFALLKQNPRHPSSHFKRIKDDLWSVRAGWTIGLSLSRARTAFTGFGSAAMPTMIGW